MRVRIVLSVETDLESWAETYGAVYDADELRESVKTYVHGAICESAASREGAIRDVQVRN